MKRGRFGSQVYTKTKTACWLIVFKSIRKNRLSCLEDGFLYTVIFLNSLLVALDSFSFFNSNSSFQDIYIFVTVTSMLLLALEYLAKLWCCTEDTRYAHPIWGRLRYALSFYSMIDLLVLLTFAIFGPKSNLIFLHLARLPRIAKYFGDDDDYSPGAILKKSFVNKKEELFITLILSLAILLLCSFVVFHFERPAQPEVFKNITPSLSWVFSILTGTSLYQFNPVTPIGKFVHVLMVILGVMVVGLPIGILTGSFISEIEESKKIRKLKQDSNTILEAFRFEQKIEHRNLAKTLALAPDRKCLDLLVAMSRLQMSEGQLLEACHFSPNLRVRACKNEIESKFDDKLVIEAFPVNDLFGSFINREARRHVISTQSTSDMAIGHYSRLLAQAIGANYYSNEFYSSANLDEDSQINFSSNVMYLPGHQGSIPKAFSKWMSTLQKAIGTGDFVLILGTCGANRIPVFHLNFGGRKGQQDLEEIETPTVHDLAAVRAFYADLSAQMQQFDMITTTHSELAVSTPNHLSCFLRGQNKANVLVLYVNIRLLQSSPMDVYLKSIRILADGMNRHIPY